jgi:hypothetical protein
VQPDLGFGDALAAQPEEIEYPTLLKQFEVIGERITHFLGPARSSIVERASFDRAWSPGGPWTPRREPTSP